MKYAHLENNTNKLLGWYDDLVHTNIPIPNIEVADEVWQEAININANCYENGKFIDKDFRTEEEKINEFQYLFRFNRDKLLVDIVDHYQKPLIWESLSEEQKDKVRQYRLDLLDATITWVMPPELVL